MRLIYFGICVLFVVLLAGCNQQENNENPDADNTEHPAGWIQFDQWSIIPGIYSGDFGGSNIRIVITYINQHKAIGYNIHRGLQRNISGSVVERDTVIEIALAEPGDHEYDGVFTLYFNKDNGSISGVWKSNSGKISPKHFTLIDISDDNGGIVSGEYEITATSFAEFYNDLTDGDGDLYFEKDGKVVYEYYPEKDTNETAEQLIRINGLWTFEKDRIIIDWQPNEKFPNRKSVGVFKKDEEDENSAKPYLILDEIKFYDRWY